MRDVSLADESLPALKSNLLAAAMQQMVKLVTVALGWYVHANGGCRYG